MSEIKKEETPEKPYSQKSFIERLLTPGIGDDIIKFIRLSIFLLMLFLTISSFLTYNIHFFIMSILTLCLYGSFEYLIKQLRKYDLLNPEETKEKRELETAKEEKKDEKKDETANKEENKEKTD